MPGVTSTERPPRAPEYISIRSAEFRAVIGATLFIMLGYGLIVPALPQFGKHFCRGDAGVSLILCGFALTRLGGDFFVGALIERFGERTVTMTGAGIVGVSSIAAGASQTFWQLVLLRGIGGFGSALFLGGLTAYLVGTVLPGERGRAMSLFQGSVGIPFFVEAAAGMLVIWHAGALSDRRGRKFVLAPALAAGVVASIGLGLFGGTIALIGWMSLLGFANGYSRPGPTAIIADVAAPEERAVAVAGYRIAGDIGALIGPVLAGVLAQYVGYGAAWIGVAACVAVVFFMTVGS